MATIGLLLEYLKKEKKGASLLTFLLLAPRFIHAVVEKD